MAGLFAHLSLARAGRVASRLKARLLELMPGARCRRMEETRRRKHGVELLDAFSCAHNLGPCRHSKVLVDGMWDNPNFWTRFAFMRAALALADSEMHGVLGPWNRERVSETMVALGVTPKHTLAPGVADLRRHRDTARQMAQTVTCADDAMKLQWPEGFPADVAYDGLLRRQRRGDVDPDDPGLAGHIAEALACLEQAASILDARTYDLVLLSHALNFDFAALAWCAHVRGVEVLILLGDYGANRFLRIDAPDAIYDMANVPSREVFDRLDADAQARMRDCGKEVLAERLGGMTLDIGAVHAFGQERGAVDRERVVWELKLDPDKPIVCVYASNWFDFPHGAPMSHFRDFRDWIDATIVAAAANRDVNWLFRAHPCDEWYGGVQGPTLADLLAKCPADHIKLVPPGWNGMDLMQAIDAGVTYFGTVAIELASIGKPALLADRGWYGQLSFACMATSREDYLSRLASLWWRGMDLEDAQDRAEQFAGWWFSCPETDKPTMLRDDSEQEDIWRTLPDWLELADDALAQEIELMDRWVQSGDRHFHVFRWLAAQDVLET